jgi:hypothetical protein
VRGPRGETSGQDLRARVRELEEQLAVKDRELAAAREEQALALKTAQQVNIRLLIVCWQFKQLLVSSG